MPLQRRLFCCAIASAMAVGGAPAFAESSEEKKRGVVLPKIDVVGSGDAAVTRQPGSVSLVTHEDIEMAQPRSTEEALRQVPGVYIKPEEESAIVANIGIRGLSSADYKTLILEDGVPVAPGLFVGNGRYYNPRIQHIHDIEVLKGAASLRYGPSTIGGVINYRTKEPQDGLAIESSVGSFSTWKNTVEIGGSSPSQEGVFGAVVSHAKSDGFMDKEYEMTDAIIKAGMAIGDDQWLGVKFGHYENDANISYRGLFLGDYKAGKTYNPAPDDWFLTSRKSFDINHAWNISADASLQTLLYWSEMYRDYWRYGVDEAASVAEGRWVYTDAVNGNNRTFERLGAETRLTLHNTSLLNVPGEAEIGLRYMQEEMEDKVINATRATPRTGTIGRDRLDSADSVALFMQNRFDVTDRLSLTPGVRVEHYEQKRKNRQTRESASTDNTEVMPGIGATFRVAPMVQVFGGVHRAFAPALNGDALDGMQDQELEAERSVNVEIGVRGRNERFNYEMTAFRMDFKNQIIPANSNTDFQQTNGGKTLHQGIEAGAGYVLGGGFRLFGNATWIPDAKFKGNRYEADGVTLDIEDGNRIPYTPKWILNAGVGYDIGDLKTQLVANYIGQQYTDTANTWRIQENTSGFFTGHVNSYTTVDLSARYAVNQKLEIFGSVKNLTDERYIASLRQGIYVGPERTFEAGLRYQF